MSLRHGLLGLLNYSDGTGYELKKAFDDSLGFFWQAHKSQIYKELTAMEKEGFLTVNLVVQENRPNKKVYSITEKGRSSLLAWIGDDIKPEDFSVRDSFLMKVFFGGELQTEEIIKKMEDFISIHKKKLDALGAVEGNIENYSELTKRRKSLYWKITGLYGCAHAEMCIEWAKDAVKLLKTSMGFNND